MNPHSSQKRVTVRDIARRLKISHTSVSRSLRDDRQISVDLRQKVQQTAKIMGYRPDPMLAALSHYRRGLGNAPICAELAWINQWPAPDKLRAFQEFNLYWQGAEEEAERCGFRLEEFAVNDRMPPERVEKILLARNIRGVLLAPIGAHRNYLAPFQWDNFCIVRFGHSVKTPRAHLVTSDQLTDGMIAYENMWHQGYRRIGLVSWAKMMTRFGAGYLLGDLDMNKGQRLPPLIMEHTDDEREHLQLLQAWIKKYKPDAILTDVKEVRGWLTKIKCRVPDDIGLAALSVLDGNASAGIDQNSREIGRAAVQLLISLINHNQHGVPETCRELLVEGRWVDGDTLPPKI
jgi:LacI family transcriptional regulator